MMASCYSDIQLYITSYAGDFKREREIIEQQVLPDLKAWADQRHINVETTFIAWGGGMEELRAVEISTAISQAYYDDRMPCFINLTSASLGLVPLWGEAPGELVDDYKLAANVTDTEMEIMFGAYRDDSPNIIYVVRDDMFLSSIANEGQRAYFYKKGLFSDKLTASAQSILAKCPGEKQLHYSYDSVAWDNMEKCVEVNIKPEFTKQILERLKQCISGESPEKLEQLDIYSQMKQAQYTFMMMQSKRVHGRQSVIDQIEEYVLTGGKDVPLLIMGGAGSGKTSIMARATNVLMSKISAGQLPRGGPNGWKIFYHFIGAVPQSTELENLLQRLARELYSDKEFGYRRDVSGLAQMCCSALANQSTKPIILLIDALNQLTEDGASVMSWVPRKLAQNVRCIFSLVNETPQHEILLSRESKPQELHLMPLDLATRRKIVKDLLAVGDKQISNAEMNLLLAKQSSENLLWLSVACEQLRMQVGDMQSCISNLSDGLLNLLESVLDGFSHHPYGHLVLATLCLLEASATGLLQLELMALLADSESLTPPSPYDEKEEKESSEKEKKTEKARILSEDRWQQVYILLRPFLRPYSDSCEGRLHFYHVALSKAVQRKCFSLHDSNEDEEDSCDVHMFWHQKLADYFENCDNVDRKVEEYLFHLEKLGDTQRLCACLCDWAIFDRLYSDEYSSQLLMYWRKAGGSEEMISLYKAALEKLEEQDRDEEAIALRYEHVARVFLQAGKYSEARELTKVVMKLEEKELGNRPERMVELYSLMSEIFDEKLKLNDFVSPRQLPDLRKTVSYGRKSIELRKQFSSDYHKFKLGMSLMKLAFSLESWEACGGGTELSGEEALREGNEHIDSALEIFKELKDDGHYAEALMTKGVLAQRGSMVQLKYYNEAMELCLQVYGEQSLLTSRLYINIGIVHEDNKDYVKAYEFFQKWACVSELVLGPQHPKTLRAKGVLKEPRYILIANRLKNQHENVEQEDGNDNIVVDSNEASINEEVEDLEGYEDMPPDIVYSSEESDGEGGEAPSVQVGDIQELYQAFAELLQRATQAQLDEGHEAALQQDNRLRDDDTDNNEPNNDNDV